MKYVEYLLILAWHVLSKIIGFFWFFVAIHFRRYARNAVYNYVLSNGIYLKRLLERQISEEDDRYIIHAYHGTEGGYIKKRYVSWLEYKIVFWLIWGFLDDDANDDTFDFGHVERLKSESAVFAYLLKNCYRVQYGNSFDLGDDRKPSFHFWASLLWNGRNTAQNFLYAQFQKREQPFLHVICGREFGWGLSETGTSYELRYGKK